MIVDDIEGINNSVAWREIAWLSSFFFPFVLLKKEVLAPWDCAGCQSLTERF